MSSVVIRNDQKAYLERTARRLSERLSTRVSPAEVAQAILDLCIQDEGIYEPKSTSPLRPETRDIYIAERDARTQPLTLEELLTKIG